MAHPIENIMKTTMEQLKEMVDVNTIVGDPVMTGSDTIIIPVSRVCLGFLSGGGEYGPTKASRRDTGEHPEEARFPFAGASVGGLNLTPMAFLAITGGVVHVLPANYNCTLDRVIEMIPETIREVDRLIKQAKEGSGDTAENTAGGAQTPYEG
ncbi:MAG TPA: GerW family sporulation protein [Feifaniaceae bacterium]|nr:GerW family sporulation protein [Feifaniaceae bacterium]